ncbi:MAG: LuxR family transcriptional regulator, partial [Candidatus Binatia bacterium]
MDIVQLNSHRHSSSGSGLSRADVEAMKAAVLLLKFMRSEFELGPIPPIDSRKMSPGLVLALLDEATESGLRGLSEVERGRKVRLGRLLADIRDVRRRLRVVPSLSTIVSVADFAGVIRSLRGAETISALCKNVCAEAASVTGLGCVSISEVNGDDWTVVGTFFAQGGGQDAGALATMPLTPGSPEKHAVDRRTAVLALPDWKRGQDN